MQAHTNAHVHTCRHTRACTRARIHARAHTHTLTSYRHSRTLPNSISNGINTEKRMSKNEEAGKVMAKVANSYWCEGYTKWRTPRVLL